MQDLTLCPVCQKKQVTTAGFSNHIKKQHQLKDQYHSLEIFRVFFHLTRKLEVREHLVTQELEDAFVQNLYRIITDPSDKLGFYNLVKYGVTFGRLLQNERPVELKDIEVMFGPYLEFKRKNSKAVNSKELCQIVFSPEQWEPMYDKLMKSKNPYTGHGKELSPFSKDFVGYKGLTEAEKIEKQKAATQHHKVGRNPNQVEYWTNKGYNTRDAIKQVSSYQTTFSLQKCIDKYGEVEGKLRFIARQDKWQASLNSKTLEELTEINRKKNRKKGGPLFSLLELELFNALQLPIQCQQVTLSLRDRYCYDIVVNDKVIEFNGDYWHCRPSKWNKNKIHPTTQRLAKEHWQFDKIKNGAARKLGYTVLVVWEGDYRNDPESVIAKCKAFLGK